MTSGNVEQVLECLRQDFPGKEINFVADGSGGGNVFIEAIDVGSGYLPSTTWIGAHLSSALPFSDIYPLFIGGEVARANGTAHQIPITAGHHFGGRPALQVSKKTNTLDATPEAAALKFTKVLHFLAEVAT